MGRSRQERHVNHFWELGRVNNNLKLFVTYLTDRFYDAMHLFGNKTQMMSKYGENIEVMSQMQLSVSLMFLDISCKTHNNEESIFFKQLRSKFIVTIDSDIIQMCLSCQSYNNPTQVKRLICLTRMKHFKLERDRFIAVEYQLVFVEFASCISCSRFSLAIVNTDCLPTFENEFYI